MNKEFIYKVRCKKADEGLCESEDLYAEEGSKYEKKYSLRYIWKEGEEKEVFEVKTEDICNNCSCSEFILIDKKKYELQSESN